MERIHIGEKNKVQMDAETWRELVALSVELGNYRPDPCNDCKLKAIDILRHSVGLGPARKPASDELVERRLALCHGCPIYRKKTDSCGRFILDAIKPKAVEMDGRRVEPCGCNITLKVRFRSEHCPANKWIGR